MQKAMTQINVRLTEVVANLTGKTGMGIMRAILSGERSPTTLVEFRDCRCKHDADTFGRALVGTWRSEHLLALSHALLGRHCGVVEEDERCGLTGIDGISDSTASIIMAEAGLNIDRFATPGRFGSWLGLCLAHDISGGNVLRRRTRSCANRVSKALRLAAQAAGRTETALGAFFRRIAARAGKPVTITATTHKLARIIWTMLTKGAAYVRASAPSAEERYRQRQIHSLIKRARVFGLQVTCPAPSEAS